MTLDDYSADQREMNLDQSHEACGKKMCLNGVLNVLHVLLATRKPQCVVRSHVIV